MQFADLHIFSYSPREGTKAAAMPDQIRNNIKKHRSKALHQLAATIKLSNMESFLGTQCQVLWEDSQQTNDEGISTIYGYTPNYLRVKISGREVNKLSNQISNCQLTALEAGTFNAELLA